jgi:tetratricopeptide (TPR) repeat protein
MANIVHLFFLYLVKFVWPYPLVHDYSFNHLKLVSWADPEAWVSTVAVLAVSVAILIGLVKKSAIGYGLLFFAAALSVYLHIVQPAPDIFAERFLFVPSLGLSIALLAALGHLAERQHQRIGIVVIGVAVLFSFSGFARNRAWKDNETLFRTDLDNLTDCCRANYNYALLLHGKYYNEKGTDPALLQPEILKYYERAYAINERLMPLLMDLGGAYMEFGYPEKAKAVFENAIRLYPEIAPGYVQMGKYHMSFKQYAQAVPYFEKAREIGQSNSDFYYLLAVCKFNSGRREEAIQDMLVGEQYGVSSPAYHYLLARLYNGIGAKDAAVEALDRGLSKFPNDAGLQEFRLSLTTD